MKTVKEWFESIKDEDVRQKALANMLDSECNTPKTSLGNAIFGGFYWDKSKEGMNYWYAQMIRAENNEL